MGVNNLPRVVTQPRLAEDRTRDLLSVDRKGRFTLTRIICARYSRH